MRIDLRDALPHHFSDFVVAGETSSIRDPRQIEGDFGLTGLTTAGTLWEKRYMSVIVESGIAARTVAAYMDLNPVRAGMVADPATYRWSSYGEAVGGGPKGNGKKACEGLVRVCMSHPGAGFEAEKWKETARIYRWTMGLALPTNLNQMPDGYYLLKIKNQNSSIINRQFFRVNQRD